MSTHHAELENVPLETILRDAESVFSGVDWVQELSKRDDLLYIDERSLLANIQSHQAHQFCYKANFSKDRFLVWVHKTSESLNFYLTPYCVQIRTFLDRKKQRTYNAVWFGSWTEGPPGHAHGGALATVLDQIVGTTSIPLLGTYVFITLLHIYFFLTCM